MPRRVRAEVSATWVIFGKEWRDLARDRRAMFFAFILPLLLYPIVYLSISSTTSLRGGDSILRIGLSGDSSGFLPFLDGRGFAVAELPLVPDAVRSGEVAILVHFAPGGDDDGEGDDAVEGPAPAGELRAIVYHAAASASSTEALRRAREALDEYRRHLLGERFGARGFPVDLVREMRVETTDVATVEEKSLSTMGRFFPFLLVVLLFSGGSFVAIDLVAGEKERGTLETLYVHPVDASAVVRGKFLVLLSASFVSVVLNVAGMLAALAIGQAAGAAPTALGGSIVLPPVRTLILILVALAPLSVLTSAVLLSLSARARSYREAQTYLLPATLVAMALVLLAMAPGVRLASVVAFVPIANVSLAVREALEGRLAAGPFIAALVSSAVYAWAALRHVSVLLRREDVILGLESPVLARDASVEGRARRGIIFGAFMLLFLYFAGSWVQSRDPMIGLWITLWILVLVPALAYPLAVRVPVAETLGLRRPGWRAILLAPLVAGALVILVVAYTALQDLVLPVPEEMKKAFGEIFQGGVDPVMAVLIFAVSPGICEELLWRGAVQGELEPRGRPASTVLWVGLFFGLFHLSIYRFFPTAAVGAVLALLRHRSGSILPCMVVHAAYNASLLALDAFQRRTGRDPSDLLGRPVIVLGAALLLAACLAVFGRPRRGPRSEPEVLASSGDDRVRRIE